MQMEISAAVASFNVLKDMVLGAKELADNNKFVTAVTETMSKLMLAQTSALGALEKQQAQAVKIGHLEAEITKLKAWNAQLQRYELAEFATGVFAYRLKESMSNGEPAHWICSQCFQDSKIGFLNYMHAVGTNKRFGCVICHHEYKTSDGDDDAEDSIMFAPNYG